MLKLTVRDGGTGKMVARIQIPLKRGLLTEPGRVEALRDLVRAFDVVRGVPRARRKAPRAPEEPTPEQPVVVETPPETPPETPAEQRAETLPMPEVQHRQPFRANQALELAAGLGVLGRSLTFSTASNVGYSGTVGALRVDATFFPFARNPSMRRRHPVISAIGLSGSWVEALPFSTTTPAGGSAAGGARRFSVALALRIATGSSLRPAFTLTAGYGEIQYTSSDPAAVGVPDTQYKLAQFGLAFEIPLATRRVSLSISALLHGVLDGGKLTSVENYGGGSGWGGDGALGITVRPLPWLFLRGYGRASALSLTFNGSGARGAASALDAFFDAMLEVGLAG
jgi:hypothetical protein